MFKVAKLKTFTWPVEVQIPQDGGKFTKATFTGEFMALEQDEIEKIVVEGEELMASALIGWKNVTDEAGEEMPFTDENKAMLIKIPYVRIGLLAAFNTAMSGGAIRQKNLR